MTDTASRNLATTVWPQTVNRIVQGAILVVVGTAILAISAKIKVPFYPVPMTLQTFAIMALAAAYGSRLAVLTVIAYLLEGFFGIPVFTNTPPEAAGFSYFFGPTAGFLIGFIPLAWIVGAAADHGWDRAPVKLFGAMIAADTVVFALGFGWLAWFLPLNNGVSGIGMAAAFSNGVMPFVLADLLKIALAAALIPACWNLIGKRG